MDIFDTHERYYQLATATSSVKVVCFDDIYHSTSKLSRKKDVIKQPMVAWEKTYNGGRVGKKRMRVDPAIRAQIGWQPEKQKQQETKRRESVLIDGTFSIVYSQPEEWGRSVVPIFCSRIYLFLSPFLAILKYRWFIHSPFHQSYRCSPFPSMQLFIDMSLWDVIGNSETDRRWPWRTDGKQRLDLDYTWQCRSHFLLGIKHNGHGRPFILTQWLWSLPPPCPSNGQYSTIATATQLKCPASTNTQSMGVGKANSHEQEKQCGYWTICCSKCDRLIENDHEETGVRIMLLHVGSCWSEWCFSHTHGEGTPKRRGSVRFCSEWISERVRKILMGNTFIQYQSMSPDCYRIPTVRSEVQRASESERGQGMSKSILAWKGNVSLANESQPWSCGCCTRKKSTPSHWVGEQGV